MSTQEIKASVQAVRSYLEAIGQPIGQVQGFEVVARARGLKSKHVLCAQGASAAQAPARAPTDEDKVSALFDGVRERLPVTVYVSAFSVTESGGAPDWARIELDEELLELLRKGASVSAREELEHVSFDRNPTDWQGDDRINWSMFVSARDFWYHGYPKYDDPVETRAIELRRLFDLIRAGCGQTDFGDGAWVDGKIYWDASANPKALAQEVQGFSDDDEGDGDGYDGSYVENHCPECGEFESECTCGEATGGEDVGGGSTASAPASAQRPLRLDDYAAKVLSLYFEQFSPDAVRDKGGVDVSYFTVDTFALEEFPRVLRDVQEVRLWEGGIDLVFNDGTSEGHAVLGDELDPDVVEGLVDDVRERASRYGFGVTGRANALDLAAQSAEVLGLEPSRKELELAADQLCGKSSAVHVPSPIVLTKRGDAPKA